MPPLDGYPTSHGSTRFSIFPHTGPASYTQITAGSPTTGGDTVQAVEAGMKYFDKVVGGISDNGLYEVKPIPVTATAKNGAPSTTMVLAWFVVATGAQVAGATNLAAVTVRLHAYGPK